MVCPVKLTQTITQYCTAWLGITVCTPLGPMVNPIFNFPWTIEVANIEKCALALVPVAATVCHRFLLYCASYEWKALNHSMQ